MLLSILFIEISFKSVLASCIAMLHSLQVVVVEMIHCWIGVAKHCWVNLLLRIDLVEIRMQVIVIHASITLLTSIVQCLPTSLMMHLVE